MKRKKETLIVIAGPTGVGKSDFAIDLAGQMGGEIINADIGSFYMPLTIGTAKPDWKAATVQHHLFDFLSEPQDFTVVEYRRLVAQKINEITSRGNLPIIVGGSGFYINVLFFPPQNDCNEVKKGFYDEKTADLWKKLDDVDSQRAMEIARSDRYRITRALDIWRTYNVKPSKFKPTFDPVAAKARLFFLTRNIEDLNMRIESRMSCMINDGWIEEVKQLSPEWCDFLMRKKIIGYDDILRYLKGEIVTNEELYALIKKKTRQYAKRQLTFNRMLIKKFEEHRDAVYTELINFSDYNDCMIVVDEKLRSLKGS